MQKPSRAEESGAVAAMLAAAVRRMAATSGDSASSEEVDCVVRLCLLGLHRDGSEDPRAMLRKVSDGLVDHFVRNVRKAREVPALARASQFFVIEWCFRNGHLVEDWAWEWESADSGKIRFNPRVPLEMIPIPSE